MVDPRPYEIALQEAQAQLELVNLEIAGYQDGIKASEAKIVAAKAKIAQHRALADYSAQYLARVEPLLGGRFVTPDQVDKARSEALAMEAAVATAQAELAQAEQEYRVSVTNLGEVEDTNARRVAAQVEVNRAKLFLDYCYVEAPFDGYITNLNITVGEYANVGEEVFAIVDRTVWYVMANFKETYLEYLEIGDLVEVDLMAEDCHCRPQRIEDSFHQRYPGSEEIWVNCWVVSIHSRGGGGCADCAQSHSSSGTVHTLHRRAT